MAKEQKVFNKKLPNETKKIFEALKPFKKRIEGLVVESTYNWYWLVDSLMEKEYRVHLASPFMNDRSDNILTAHTVNHEGLVHNHKTCNNLLDTVWYRRFSGPP